MPRTVTLLSLGMLLVFLNACQCKQPALSHTIKAGCKYYSLRRAQCLNKEEMLKELSPYKVIFIGDHHTQKRLHEDVAMLIDSLSRQGTRVHLANEWFYPSDNETLHAYVNDDINETAFLEAISWDKRLRFYPYSSFKPMYASVKANHGELYGINLSKAEQKRISEQNLSAMSAQELTFYKELDLKTNPHQTFIMPYLNHCHAPKENESLQACRERMYRVQVAWDSKMAIEAYKLSTHLKKNEKLLVFAGAMHIENTLGIPLRFSRLSNQPTLSIIPADTQTKEIPNGTADFVLFYSKEDK